METQKTYTVIRALKQLHSRTTAASIDFHMLKGRMARALEFLDYDVNRSPEELADKFEGIRHMLADITPSLEQLEAEKLEARVKNRVLGSAAHEDLMLAMKYAKDRHTTPVAGGGQVGRH